MTRLADALQRASESRGDAEHTFVPAAAGTKAAAATATLAVAEPMPAPAVDRSAAARPAVSAGPRATPLLGTPQPLEAGPPWRERPRLIGRLLGTDGFPPGALEQYRKLAATLHHVQGERGIKVIMTTSALPAEGKSLTTVNLALTLAESYHRRVILIDADLRRPTIQEMFGLPIIGGLNEGLKADRDRTMPLTALTDRFCVLPAGRPESDPISGLTSERMRRLVAQASSAFDWVIIDTPPVALLPDANLLAEIVDGVLLVVRSGKCPFPLAKRSVEAIGHNRILGVVVNAVDTTHDRYAGGYYTYYGGYYGASPNK